MLEVSEFGEAPCPMKSTNEGQLFCAFCGIQVRKVIASGQRVNFGYVEVRQCQNCGLKQTYPHPSGVDGVASPVDMAILKQHFHENKQKWQQYMSEPLDIASRFKERGAKLLDVGCNVGHLVELAAGKYGFDAHGIDVAPGAIIAKSEGGLRTIQCSLSDAPYEPATFDVVTVVHVLEHVTNVIQLLADIAKILKPDGIILINVPNFGSAVARIKGVHWQPLAPDQHLWQFDPPGLRKVLTSARYEIVCWSTSHCDFYNFSGWRGKIKKLAFSLLERSGLGDNLFMVARPAKHVTL